MIKILHIYKSYFPDTHGGIEQFIRTLSTATAPFEVQNSLLTTSKLPSAVTPSLRVFRTPINFTLASCPFSKNFFKQFKKLAAGYDVIHVHFPWPFGELVTQLLIKPHQKLIITYHADIIRQKYYKWLYYPLMQRLFKRANQIVTTSNNLLNSSSVLKPFVHKTHVIPLAVNPTDYPTPTKSILKAWQQQIGENFILFIGQFRYYKGIEVLLKALSGTAIPCVLIGDGMIKPQLENLAKSLKLSNVHFVGSVKEADKIAIITLSKIVILPSTTRSEAFGLALLEGLLFQKPLITTELQTGTSFVNQHNYTGLVVPPNNVVALRQAICKLMHENELHLKLQQATLSHLNKNFDISQVAARYFALYKE